MTRNQAATIWPALFEPPAAVRHNHTGPPFIKENQGDQSAFPTQGSTLLPSRRLGLFAHIADDNRA